MIPNEANLTATERIKNFCYQKLVLVKKYFFLIVVNLFFFMLIKHVLPLLLSFYFTKVN